MTDDATRLDGQGGLDAPGENMRAVMIGNAVLGYRRGVDKPAARRKVGLGTLRLAAVQRLIEGRHGGPCDTDDGELYLEAAAPLIVASAHRRGVTPDLASWAMRWTPKLYDDHGPEWFADRQDNIDPDDGRGVTADDFARALGITAAEVKAFGLKTVGAVDRPKRQRTIDRKAADRVYQKAKRAKAGATPRELSATATRPWEAFGITERTWRRWGKPIAPDVRNSSAPTTAHKVPRKTGNRMVPTKTGHGSATAEGRTTVTAAADMPAPTPVVDGDDAPQAPAIVLEIGRVVVDVVQLAAWEGEFPGVDVVSIVTEDAWWLNNPDNDNVPWEELASMTLSIEHHKMMEAANENEKKSEAV